MKEKVKNGILGFIRVALAIGIIAFFITVLERCAAGTL
jgi:hypothetical protein